MVKKTLQKLVPLDKHRKDMKKIELEIADGWKISNMIPHHDEFLCVLEKIIEVDEEELRNEKRIISSLRSKKRDKAELEKII